MDMAELVRTIVQEVIERTQADRGRPCVRVIAYRDEALAARVEALMAPFLAAGADILFLGEESGGRDAVRYILPVLSCSDMAELAAGRASSPCTEEVLGLLLRGVPVEVLEFSYRAYAETAPGPLYELYETCEKTLAGYGLKEFRPARRESVRVREKLITAAVVEKASEDGHRRLIVPASASITPLAAETADALHMSIVKEG